MLWHLLLLGLLLSLLNVVLMLRLGLGLSWLLLLLLRLLLLRTSQSMALQGDLGRTCRTGYQVAVHILVNRNFRRLRSNRELALEGCTGRVL
jgi:hypothetical protein